MTTRDDWSGCDSEAQEETLYTLIAMTRILNEGSAKLGKCTGKHAVPLMTQRNLMCISAHTRAANLLRDLADGALVAVNPLASKGIEDFHAKKGKLWEQYNEVVKERDKAHDEYMKAAAEGSPSEWRDEHDKRVKERDEARSLRDIAVEQCGVIRADRDEARRVNAERYEEIRELGAALDKATRDLVKMVFSEHEMRKERDDALRVANTSDRPGSWGAGKGPTSEAKDTFVDAMAKPAEVKPSCHGCTCRSEHGCTHESYHSYGGGFKTISKPPGAPSPDWCPLLEANQ